MAIDYSSILNQASAAYNQTLTGYRNTLQQQQQAQQGVMSGYNQLQANVLKGLEGSSAAARQDIIDQYTAASGKQQQGMISRGLGNTTVMDAMQRGLGYDQAKAQTMRANEFAKTAAGYQSQLGLAGLGYAGNALQSNLQFAGQGLQYGGQGAMQLGNLGLGFAQLENQRSMQEAQMKQARMNELFGVSKPIGGGGGGSSGGGPKIGFTTPSYGGRNEAWLPGGYNPRSAPFRGYDPNRDINGDPLNPAASAGWNPEQYGWGGESGGYGYDDYGGGGGGGEFTGWGEGSDEYAFMTEE